MLRQVWFCDFEFHAPAGNRPEPICHVAKELRSGEIVRTWLYGAASERCPYPTGKDSLTVAYHASAELGCHLALGWKIPANILCLEAEFRALCSGRKPKSGYSLVGALDHFNLETVSAALKDEGRNLGIRGGPFTAG